MTVTTKYRNALWTHVEFTVGEEVKVRRLGAGLMDWDGHNFYSPDGKFMLSDSDGMCDALYERFIAIMRMEDGAVKSIGTFKVPPQYRGSYWRCDLHGRFSADGSLFGFNSVHEGSRQVYVMEVK